MRKLPLGIQDFKEVRDKDLYFVDRSSLIAGILDSSGKVHICTRPRRFGKSMNLSMLDAYFNQRYAGNSWFDGLNIARIRQDDPEKNSNVVINISFKDLSVESYDEFIEDFILYMSDVYSRYPELKDSDKLNEIVRGDYDAVCWRRSSRSVLRSSIARLCDMLGTHYGKEIILLIDEYDKPVNNANGDVRDRILAFLKQVYGESLKDNPSLRFAVVTGVMQIAKEKIFSDLNNLKVNNVLNTEIDEMFGFTAEEVRTACNDYGHPEKFEEAKKWYDGYRFGNTDIYNPWSIISYIDSGFVPKGYWTGTSGNSIIKDLLDMADQSIMDDLGSLASGKTADVSIEPKITYAEMGMNRTSIYSVMVMSGYLKAIPNGAGYSVSIPNLEMYDEFGKVIANRFEGRVPTSLMKFTNAVLAGDDRAIEECLYGLIADTVSVRALDNEHSYQMLMIGMMMQLSGRYRITADMESGKGYHDIRMQRLKGDGPNIVMELKVKGGSNIDTCAKAALEQILERDYAHGLSGKTIMYGICFDSKKARIVSESIVLR